MWCHFLKFSAAVSEQVSARAKQSGFCIALSRSKTNGFSLFTHNFAPTSGDRKEEAGAGVNQQPKVVFWVKISAAVFWASVFLGHHHYLVCLLNLLIKPNIGYKKVTLCTSFPKNPPADVQVDFGRLRGNKQTKQNTGKTKRQTTLSQRFCQRALMISECRRTTGHPAAPVNQIASSAPLSRLL